MKKLIVLSSLVLPMLALAQTPENTIKYNWLGGNGTARVQALVVPAAPQVAKFLHFFPTLPILVFTKTPKRLLVVALIFKIIKPIIMAIILKLKIIKVFLVHRVWFLAKQIIKAEAAHLVQGLLNQPILIIMLFTPVIIKMVLPWQMLLQPI